MKLYIKELREEQNISQKDLSDALGISFSLLSKYENGKIMPSAFRIKQIAEKLNVPIEKLIKPNGVEDIALIQKSDKNSKISILGGKTQCLSYNERIFRSFIIKQANGTCELCGTKAPFIEENGDPHLYVFKIKSENLNSFDPQEYVAVCSNCADKLTMKLNDEDIAYLGDAAKNHKYKILKEEVE